MTNEGYSGEYVQSTEGYVPRTLQILELLLHCKLPADI